MPPVPWDRRPFAQVQRRLRRETNHESIARRARRLSSRVRRRGADLEYFAAEPLRAREGVIIVWAGMRGAVTLAAAQTLPTTAPHRPFLLLVAMLVAAGSLTIQGLTLSALVRLAKPAMAGRADDEDVVVSMEGHDGAQSAEPHPVDAPVPADSGQSALQAPVDGLEQDRAGGVWPGENRATENSEGAENAAVSRFLRRQGTDLVLSTTRVARAWTDPTWRHEDLAMLRDKTLDIIRAQREALLDAGDDGLYSAASLEYALGRLDMQEIMLTSDPH